MYSGKGYLEPYIKLLNSNLKKNAQESLSLCILVKSNSRLRKF